ncbi:MAG: NAD(P)H-hydrate epimerase [Propionibacteriaceae bacterium]|nr:NAD(P)H-hydrate epimerase [Propionibacteriaceae bacterium]
MGDQPITSARMKALDEATINDHHVPSLVLMERAALACLDVLHTQLFDLACVKVLCGPGNNGGDGVALARLLHLEGGNAQVFLIGNPTKFTDDLSRQITIAQSYGVPLTYGIEHLTRASSQAPTTVIDAILGIGSQRQPEGDFLEAVRYINTTSQYGTRVLAVDIPTGVNADTGEILGEAVRVDVTVTFAYPKIGLTVPPGSHKAGHVVVADIGIYQ